MGLIVEYWSTTPGESNCSFEEAVGEGGGKVCAEPAESGTPAPPQMAHGSPAANDTGLAVTPDGPKYAFFEGQIVPIEDAKVSVMTTTLHYGTGCFGGLRAYWSEERNELFAFRLIEHYTRFLNSCKLLMAELPYTAQDLADITVDLLRKENYRSDVYMRPLHYKADLHGGLQVHGMMDEVTIYAYVQYFASPKSVVWAQCLLPAHQPSLTGEKQRRLH